MGTLDAICTCLASDPDVVSFSLLADTILSPHRGPSLSCNSNAL